jgi:hypothetical protein
MKELNNNITESRCSFEVSKLLKEKGCDIPCNAYYVLDFQNFKADGVLHEVDYFTNRCHQFHIASAPTHALAIEWIRVNYNVFISIHQEYKGIFWAQVHVKGDYIIPRWEVVAGIHDDYSTPQAATEAGLKFVLEELV